MSVLNQRLKKIIDKMNITQTQFADESGLSDQAISQYLKGKINIAPKSQIAICEAFPSINANWFLFGRGDVFNEADLSGNEPIESDYLKKLIGEKNQIIALLKQRLDDQEHIIKMMKEAK